MHVDVVYKGRMLIGFEGKIVFIAERFAIDRVTDVQYKSTKNKIKYIRSA